MPITYTHSETKGRIISFINKKGPSLPVQIARAINVSPLFASAFLSELYGEGRLKISNLRVGSSPLYYISGQEDDLEKFTQYLNQKEREAFNIIKKEKVINDENQLPAIRVALRAIKDFAIPLKLDSDEKQRLFWKYFALTDQEARSFLEPKPEMQEVKEQVQPAQENKEEIILQQAPQIETPIQITQPIQQQVQPALSSAPLIISDPQKEIKKKPKKPAEESQFQKYLKEYLPAKEIEIIELVSDKKKEITAKIRIDTLFGKQEFYLMAKDKKKVTESDLNAALQKSNSLNMPAILMSPGELDKKAKEYLKPWKNLLKFEKLSL